MTPMRKKGFTLIELMIAIALGLIIIGVCVYTLRNTGLAVARTTELADFSLRATAITEIITADLMNRDFRDIPDPEDECNFVTSVRNFEYNMDGALDSSDFRYETHPVGYSLTGTILKRHVDYTTMLNGGGTASYVIDNQVTAFSLPLSAGTKVATCTFTLTNESGNTRTYLFRVLMLK